MANFCNSCATPLETGAKFCGRCGAVVEAAPSSSAVQPVPTSQSFSHAQGRRYPALRIIAVILKVLAALTAIGGVLSGIAAGSIPSPGFGVPGGGAIVLLVILGGLGYALFLWASAEMINVVLDIEENTRRAAG
ncbi:MAG: zinc ribbon domain-containing protein [Candidatus Korobacteraceae bacterium]